MRSSVLRPLLVLLLALAAVLPGTAASAHTSLSGTDPEQGAEVTDLQQVTLEFTGAVLDLGTTLALVQGEERITLEPTFPNETTVVADVPALASGEWSLMYRVVAEDGHPLEGQVDFTVIGADPEPSDSPSTDPTDATTVPSEDSTPIASEISEPVPSPSPSAVAQASGDGGWVRFAGAAVLLVVAAAVIVWLRRRDDGSPSDGNEPSDDGDGGNTDEQA